MKLKLTMIFMCVFAITATYSQSASLVSKKTKANQNTKENILSAPTISNSDRDMDNAWLHWDSGTNNNGIGTNDGSTFTVAARWEVGDLSAYNGDKVSKVKVFIYEEGYSSIVLKIWTGNNASNLVYQKQLTSINPGTWKETILPTEIFVNSNQEFWVGYTVFNPLSTKFPAGTDAGPALKQKGDMISFDEVSWFSLAEANPDLDYNWNIQFFVEGQTTAVTADFSASQTSITTGQSVTFNNLSSGANEWTWAFEGGSPSISSQQNPTVTYNTEGTFNVTLTAKNGAQQDVETKTDYITVSASGSPLSVEFTADPSTTICEFGSTTLTAVASGGTGGYQYTWTWDINNQSVSGNVLEITNLSQSTNVYLKVVSGSQEVNETIAITVEDNPPSSVVGKGNPERILICPHPDLEYQWFQNNTIIDGATKQFYYPGSFVDLSGTYYVLTTNTVGCKSYSENYTIGNNKTSDMAKTSFMSVYPNPAVSGFNISINPELLLKEVNSYKVEIYSINGMKLWETEFNPSIDMRINPPANLSSGLYIVKLKGGEEVFDTQKLVIN